MALAVWDGAGDLLVAIVAIHHQTTGEPGLPEDLVGNTRPPGLAEEKDAEPRGGELPGIAILAVRPPARLVGMCDGSLALCLDQPLRKAGKQARHPVQDLDQAPRSQARLVADAPHRDTVQRVHRGRRGDELVPRETFGQDGRGLRLEGAPAAGAIALGQPVEDALGLHRATFQDGPARRPLVLQGGMIVRAVAADLDGDVHDPLSMVRVERLATGALMSRPCPSPLGGICQLGAGLDGEFGRGGRRPKEALLGLARLIPEVLLEALEFLGEPIDLPRLLQTSGAPVDGHPRPHHGPCREAPVLVPAWPQGHRRRW
jgi:hypothetical protein